ncbi:MAG: hypothetical protein EXS64_21045 [Candidatus Latescibacteria bacterium]|nr:hypothetical protein [Candidatus Latescibacterota bacterium]
MFHPKIPIFRPGVKAVFEGFWLPHGLVRVDLPRQPQTHRQRRTARRSALRQVLAALEAPPC